MASTIQVNRTERGIQRINRTIDNLFTQPVSAQNKNNTVVGGILTTIILEITLGYFVSSLQGMISGNN